MTVVGTIQWKSRRDATKYGTTPLFALFETFFSRIQ